MNRSLTATLASILVSLNAAVYAGTPIKQSDLPEPARTILNKYFPNDNIRKAEKDNGRRGLEFEVDLMSGAEIEFMENGEWKDIKAARGASVPSALIPNAIAKYVSSNFKGRSIIEISRKRYGYEIELSDGTELKLTKDAKPVSGRPDRKR